MNDLNERIQKLRARADAVSGDVRKAEAMLREIPLSKTCEYGSIKWDAEKKRIMMGEKPLIEQKLEARIDGHWFLECLINRVIFEAEDEIGFAGESV